MNKEKFELNYDKCLDWLAKADLHMNTPPINWRGDHAFRSAGHSILRHQLWPYWVMTFRANAITGDKYIDFQCGDSDQLVLELNSDNSIRISLYDYIANVTNRNFRRSMREMFGFNIYSSNCLAPGWVYPTPVKFKPISKAHLPKNKLMLVQPAPGYGISGYDDNRWSKIFVLNGRNIRLKRDRTIFSGTVDTELTIPDREKRKPLQARVRALRGLAGMFRSIWEPLNEPSDRNDYYARRLAYWHGSNTPDKEEEALKVLETEDFSAQDVFGKAVSCAGKAREILSSEEDTSDNSNQLYQGVGKLLSIPEYYLMSRLMLSPSIITKLIQVNRVSTIPFLYLDHTVATPAALEQRDRLDSKGD